jgi:hypothetical protein
VGVEIMDVLIHFGFPKTGSSTLQFGPLNELGERGKIKLSTWRKNDDKEILDSRPSSCLFRDMPIGKEYLNFSKSKLNVLSDESFTAPVRLRMQNYGKEIQTPFKFPTAIKSQIILKYGEQVNFKCLAVIRNQAKLISSQYVEEYNWKRYKDIDLLFNKVGEVDLHGYEIYNFSKYFDELVNVFGEDNCTFLMYEDWKNQPFDFINPIANLLDVTNEWLNISFNKFHVNGKKKSKHGVFTKDSNYFVPYLREDILNCINKHFQKDNYHLKDYFPATKLKKYGYIK